MLVKKLPKKQCWVLEQHCILIREKKNKTSYSLWKTSIYPIGPMQVCAYQCLIFQKTSYSDQCFATLGLIAFHTEMSSLFESHFGQDGGLLYSLRINRGWERRERALFTYVLPVKLSTWTWRAAMRGKEHLFGIKELQFGEDGFPQ